MAETLSDWLALREAADAAARSVALTRAVAEKLPHDRPLRAVDLGTGTGSNIRYLMPRLAADVQQWLLVDADPTLLSKAVRSLRPMHSIVVETREMNLGALDARLFSRRDLVTASALLDLVSERWLGELASECRTAGAAVLFALTYDGRSHCDPPEPEDDEVRGLMNRHQRQNDKGFGRAAGPDAVAIAERSFAEAGYHVMREPADWVLAPDSRELQRQLVDGWAVAAREMAPDRSAAIDDWLRRRLEHIVAGRSRITVGHEDLGAWPSSR